MELQQYYMHSDGQMAKGKKKKEGAKDEKHTQTTSNFNQS